MIPSSLNDLFGNENIKTYLRRIVEKEIVGHSLLFFGPDGIGKAIFARILAAMVMGEVNLSGPHSNKIRLGIHPDIHEYYPEGKLGLHSIQSMRELTHETLLPSYESPWKFFIIHDADRMLPTSSNALLKAFEEPPCRTLIILLTSHLSQMLPTIRSRCRTLHFQAVARQEIESYLKHHFSLGSAMVSQISLWADGSIGRAAHLAQQGGDRFRALLLDALSKGPRATYKELKAILEPIIQAIELQRKEIEVALQGSVNPLPKDHLSASQIQAIEKEIAGRVSLQIIQKIDSLLVQLLSWFRDIELLLNGGDRKFLLNGDYLEGLEQTIQKGNFPRLDQVQGFVDETRLALQRSTSLDICIENLFLKLNWIQPSQEVLE